jgi:hypothetical protein
VPFPRAEVDLRTAPADFDALIEWLEAWSYNLVLLEDYPLEQLRVGLAAVESAVRAHREVAEHWLASRNPSDEETMREAIVLQSDHEWFETSIAQFWWFFRVVENEDHGGHRQALGQYGRVLAEALRRHRADEQPVLSAPAPLPVRSGP